MVASELATGFLRLLTTEWHVPVRVPQAPDLAAVSGTPSGEHSGSGDAGEDAGDRSSRRRSGAVLSSYRQLLCTVAAAMSALTLPCWYTSRSLSVSRQLLPE